ncbi:hypothetical protein Aglo01_46490 [Actinokineospora globicatena]|nr:hypothetical protein Aglo01_46490 [Actinokineospora globicatena]GLW86997.1 hypothetical protein Aglo02_46360 [Actinokineospora globicatena]
MIEPSEFRFATDKTTWRRGQVPWHRAPGAERSMYVQFAGDETGLHHCSDCRSGDLVVHWLGTGFGFRTHFGHRHPRESRRSEGSDGTGWLIRESPTRARSGTETLTIGQEHPVGARWVVRCPARRQAPHSTEWLRGGTST